MRFKRQLQENFNRCKEQFAPGENSLAEILARAGAVPGVQQAESRPKAVPARRYWTAAVCACVAAVVALASVLALVRPVQDGKVAACSTSSAATAEQYLAALDGLEAFAAAPEGMNVRYALSTVAQKTVSVGMTGMLSAGEMMRADFVLDAAYVHGDEYVHDVQGVGQGSVQNYRVKTLEDSMYEYQYIAFERGGVRVYAQYKHIKGAGEAQSRQVFLDWVDRFTA